MKKRSKPVGKRTSSSTHETTKQASSQQTEKDANTLSENMDPRNVYAASAGNPGADDYQWGK